MATAFVDKVAAVPRLVLTVLLLALVATLLWNMRPAPEMNTMTAYFSRTVALYPGSEVRVLGVARSTR